MITLRQTQHINAFIIPFFLLLSMPNAGCSQKNELENAEVLNQQVTKLYGQGRYLKAIPIAVKALSIRENILGQDDPAIVQSLNDLAGLYSALGDYGSAEPLYRKSVDICEKAFGPEHPDLAGSLNNLALLYHSLGDYGNAEPLFKRSLAIYEKALGQDHPHVAASLNNLAGLYLALGEYEKAEMFYKQSLDICEKALEPNHPHVAQSLNNLATLYSSLGDYEKAKSLYQRSLVIREKALGHDHPDVGANLNNLAFIYKSLGDYEKAESLYQRSLVIRKKALGPNHPDVAESLNNLASLYDSLGEYAKSESFYEKSLAIDEKISGPNHINVAKDLNNLAVLYRILGDYSNAEALFKRSIEIYEKALVANHPHAVATLNNLAVLYADIDEFEKAHNLFKKAQEIDCNLIDTVMGFTSEDQKVRFLATKKWNLYGFLSLISQHLSQSPTHRKDALDIWLKRKGVILEAQRRFQEALVYSDDPEAVKTFQELAGVRARLSKLAFGGPGKEGPDAYKKRIADLEAQKQGLEARLSRLSHAFALKQKISKADSEKLAGMLPKNTALIEFAAVELFDFKAKGKEKKWKPAHYIAFVLHAGNGDRVAMIDLGEAEKIDIAVGKFKKEVGELKEKKGIKLRAASKSIYDMVFEPIKNELGDVKEIFISPDGNLNLIPFEVLQGPVGRYLIEDYTFNYLAAGRDLLGFGEIFEKGQKALLMGDPDFDMGAEEKSSTLRRLALRDAKQEKVVTRSTEMKGFHFSNLPGTREEVKAIQDIIGKDNADLYTGKEALEEVLRTKGAPKILHLATHGFFLTDLDLKGFMDESMVRGMQQISGLPIPTGKKAAVENPLLRSGIALAGANKALESGDAGKSDGIVTAEKILGFRLRGTEMVVLSACETGLGEVKTGEGVFGLRRAFTQAGAKSLVMSMWSVPDKETRELMIQFYQNILSGKMNRCQALRQAALREMQILKERYGYANPFYWGAFVFMGEP
jgi:CHAT domain-containing protein/Tfp pilus assembly protein PilF